MREDAIHKGVIENLAMAVNECGKYRMLVNQPLLGDCIMANCAIFSASVWKSRPSGPT
jgi:hypothetical protein